MLSLSAAQGGALFVTGHWYRNPKTSGEFKVPVVTPLSLSQPGEDSSQFKFRSPVSAGL